MKRITLLCLSLLLLLTGCGKSSRYRIEDQTWLLNTVQSLEADGAIIARGTSETDDGTALPALDLLCSAEHGTLTLTDRSTDETYRGTCKRVDRTADSATYEITLGTTDGIAVVAETTYQNGDKRPTLILRLGDYTLSFFPAE